jgi:hypothetical protein
MLDLSPSVGVASWAREFHLGKHDAKRKSRSSRSRNWLKLIIDGSNVLPPDSRSRVRRIEEDLAAVVTTVDEIRGDVKWLERAVGALLADRNLTVSEDDNSGEVD